MKHIHKNNEIDLPETTIKRSKIAKEKYILNKVYVDFYNKISTELSRKNKMGFIVELGSGGGFIKEIIPNTTTSDVIDLPMVDMKFSAIEMPFKKNSINAILMIDVLHHIHDVGKFLREAQRCLKKGGQIVMIEPANTFFGRFIFKNFHHEAFDENAGWTFRSTGPLSSSNQALPWIVFVRDKKNFEKKFPDLSIQSIEAHTPFKFLISGGFGYIQLLPNFLYPLIVLIEKLLAPWNKYLGMFYTINIMKR